jgi:CheY-like chemotaxis protein
MGGDILVESREGEGSCFHFTLPLEITDQAVVCQAAPILPELAKLDVLLAEDNPVNAKVMESFLRREGHRVTVAGNGQAALTAASQQRFDVILMDMQMPVMDGLEATRLIRALPGDQAQVPILGVTANAFVEDKTLCLEAGMNGYLSKPVNRNDLFAAIARLVV